MRFLTPRSCSITAEQIEQNGFLFYPVLLSAERSGSSALSWHLRNNSTSQCCARTVPPPAGSTYSDAMRLRAHPPVHDVSSPADWPLWPEPVNSVWKAFPSHQTFLAGAVLNHIPVHIPVQDFHPFDGSFERCFIPGIMRILPANAISTFDIEIALDHQSRAASKNRSS